MSGLTMARLRYLFEVVRLGGVRLAADFLDVAPSAVSRQVAMLEKIARTPLLETNRRGAKPTEVGLLLIAYYREQVAREEALVSQLDGMNALESGHVALGAVQGFADDLMRHALSEFNKAALWSTRTSKIETVPLQGALASAPDDVQAFLPLANWASSRNLLSTTQWLPSSAYLKIQQQVEADYVEVQDCNAVTPSLTGTPIPCATGQTIEGIFPFVFRLPGAHPSEVEFLNGGTISMQQGVRMWVAAAQQGPLDPSYRVFFELNGNVYCGVLKNVARSCKLIQQRS